MTSYMILTASLKSKEQSARHTADFVFLKRLRQLTKWNERHYWLA